MLLPMAAMAADNAQLKTVYLNNGHVITGIVEQAPQSPFITVQTADGRTYSYMLSEVREIADANTAKIPAKGGNSPVEGYYSDHAYADRGFWIAAESVTGITCRMGKKNADMAFEEIDVTAGYRFNQYIRVGVGAGVRYYLYHNNLVRNNSVKFSAPLFFNIRGSLMARAERKVVPYYSLDIGGCFRDGFMIRPAVGIRVGGLRNAFTAAIAYTGQSTDLITRDNGVVGHKRGFLSMPTIKLGYEF